MKLPISLWACMCLFTVSSFAQKSFQLGHQHVGKPHGFKSAAAPPTDTLGFDDFFESTATIYDAPGSGYASGNNPYGDKAKAQVFALDSSLILQEVLLWFGAKDANSGDVNSKLKVKIHHRNGNGTASGGDVDDAPGEGIDSVEVLVSAIDVAQFTSVVFSNNPIIFDDFAVSVHFSTLAAGDTLGLYTTADGGAATSELSWELWADNTWHTIYDAWDLDVDLAIWPVIDASSSSVADNTFFEGLKMSQNMPNPALEVTTVQFELESHTNYLNFEVFNAAGKKVYAESQSELNAGLHNISFDVSDFASGAYYYSIQTSTGRITKKMLVGK